MPAYCIVNIIEVHDEEMIAAYRAKVSDTVEAHGGRYLVIGGTVEVMEGDWKPVYPVVFEFPTMDAARGWYGSEEYRELKDLRRAASTSELVFVEGLESQRR